MSGPSAGTPPAVPGPIAVWQVLLLQAAGAALAAHGAPEGDDSCAPRLCLARHVESGEHFRLLVAGESPLALVEPCRSEAVALVDLGDPTGWARQQHWELGAEIAEPEIVGAALAEAPAFGAGLRGAQWREQAPVELVAGLIGELIGLPGVAGLLVGPLREAGIPAEGAAELIGKLATLIGHATTGHAQGVSKRPGGYRSPLLNQDSVAIGSSTLLPQTFRAMRAPGQWKRPGDGHPPYYEEANDDAGRGEGLKVIVHPSDGRALLTPEEEEACYAAVMRLDDDKVRAFAIALGAWFAGTGGGDPKLPKVTLTANAMLEFQGIKRNKGAYRAGQKEKIARDVWALSTIFIRGPQVVYDARGRRKVVRVRSRLLEVAQEDEVNLFGEETPYAFRVAPGEWIKPLIEEGTRYVATLLTPVLRYNPKQGTELIAMRIGLHLALHWRFRAAQGNFDQPWRVATLLESTAVAIPAHREQRRRLMENFERALDRLRQDAVLASWEYDRCGAEENPHAVFPEWIDRTVRIVPPPPVLEQYAGIARRHRLEAAATRRQIAKAKQ